MIRALHLIILCFAIASSSAQAPAIVWQKALGGTASDVARSIQQCTDGGYIVAGFTLSNDGDVTGNHGTQDFWITKLDGLGNLIWQSAFGGSNLEWGTSIQQCSDGGYIAAGYTGSDNGDVTTNQGGSDVWVVKLDPFGNLVWQKTFGGGGFDAAYSIQECMDGGYIVAGTTRSNDGDVTGHHGDYDSWIVKLDILGNLVWQKSLGGSDAERAYSIHQSTEGGYIVAGSSESNDGDVIGNLGNTDYWIFKIDSIGNILWQKVLGGSDEESATSVHQCADGGYIVAGHTRSTNGDVSNNHGDLDLWVVKLDSLGDLLWQRTFGGSDKDAAFSIGQSPDGGYIVAGSTASIDGDATGVHGQDDCWVIKLDPLGNLIWQKAFGGSGNEMAASIQHSMDGGYVMAGNVYSNDGDVNQIQGSSDFWVIKLTDDFARMNGQIFADLNSDNMLNAGEPTIGSHAIENLNTAYPYFSDPNGNYSVVVLDTGLTTIAPAPITYYTASPANRSASFAMLNQQVDSLHDFAMQPDGLLNDLGITLTPIGFYRPGFRCRYRINYSNAGTTTIAPTVLFFPDPWLAFDSASTTATTVTPDSVIWQIPTLAPFGSGQITVYLMVDPNAGFGTTLNSFVRIEPQMGDAHVGDNTATWSVITQGSFDPNDIIVDRDLVHVQDLNPVPPDLTYIIRFQNTGTDTAFTVRIENDVPANVDLSTFQFESSSHPALISYLHHADRMQYTFNNILLPDSNTNEAASHGYIRYRIKPRNTLLVGDSVLNDARIYFDFNAPVETNVAVTVIETSTSIGDGAANDLLVSPNPSDGVITVSLHEPQRGMITAVDAAGREVLHTAINGTQQVLDLRGQPGGVYQLTIRTAAGSFTRSIVLE